MVLNVKKLLGSTGGQLVNFNFFDIAAGTGYINFYGGITSGAYLLSNIAFYSDLVINASGLIASTAYLQMLSKDYDVLFNMPQNVRGKAIINVPLGAKNSDANPRGFNAYVLTKIKKWDGTTATTIATESSPVWITQGASLVSVAGSGYVYKMMIVTPTIPATHFKKGETLRVTTEVWGVTDVSGLGTITLLMANDPYNRATTTGENYTFGTAPTILNVQIPLKLDL